MRSAVHTRAHGNALGHQVHLALILHVARQV